METINQYYPESVTQPSEFLKELLEEIKMTPKEFAVMTRNPVKTILAVLNGDYPITPDMAIAFEQVLRVPAHFWNEAQINYDDYKARINCQKNVEQTQIV